MTYGSFGSGQVRTYVATTTKERRCSSLFKTGMRYQSPAQICHRYLQSQFSSMLLHTVCQKQKKPVNWGITAVSPMTTKIPFIPFSFIPHTIQVLRRTTDDIQYSEIWSMLERSNAMG